MDAAALGIPPQPKFPFPSGGGTKGCQFALATSGCWNRNQPPTTRKIQTIVTLMITTAELKLADSLIPITRMAVMTMTISYGNQVERLLSRAASRHRSLLAEATSTAATDRDRRPAECPGWL